MATTNYGLHTIDYGVTGWDAIMTTDMEIIDREMHNNSANQIMCHNNEVLCMNNNVVTKLEE